MDLRLQALIDQGLLTEDFIESCPCQEGETQVEAVLRQSFFSEMTYLKTVSTAAGVPYYDLCSGSMLVSPEYPVELLQKHFFVPIRREKDALIVAVADPFDRAGMEELEFTLAQTIIPMAASPRTLRLIVRLLANKKELKPFVPEQDDVITDLQEEQEIQASEKEDTDWQFLENRVDTSEPEENHIILMVEQILAIAKTSGCTEVYVEAGTEDGDIRIRTRVDGECVYLKSLKIPQSLMSAIVARLKIMAFLNITEKYYPQSGAITTSDAKYELHTLPTLRGEEILICPRPIYDQAVPYEAIGIPGTIHNHLSRVIEKQRGGLILVAAPFGSGAKTTLYAILDHFISRDKKILTIESHPRYPWDRVSQIRLNVHAGLSYAFALRSAILHRADALLLDEMVDFETADTAIKAANQGILIFGRIHTERCWSGVTRLLEMGLDISVVMNTLRTVIAQRLVRLLCPDCKSRGNKPEYPYEATGCPLCHYSGFRGVRAVFEAVFLDNIATQYLWHRYDSEIVKQLIRHTYPQMREMALELARSGLTSYQEAIAKTPQTDSGRDEKSDYDLGELP